MQLLYFVNLCLCPLKKFNSAVNKNQSINEIFDHSTWDFYNLTIHSQNVYSLGADMYVDHHPQGPSSNLNMQHCFAYLTYIWYVRTCSVEKKLRKFVQCWRDSNPQLWFLLLHLQIKRYF